MISRNSRSNSGFLARLRQRSALNKFERPLWAFAIAFATLGVFWLPWQLPSTTPINGESYALGFNNRVAIYCLALAIASATAARLVAPTPQTALRWLSRGRRPCPKWRAAKAEYVVLGVCTFLWAYLLWSWGASLVDPAWGDARVNIYNIDLLAIGRVPYRDFMVIYGFSMIYLPYWLSCLTGGDVSFEQAYHAVLVLFIVAGFLAVFVFLRALRLPAWWRPAVLLVVLLSWAIFVTALAHGPLRYTSVPASLILMHQAIKRWGGSGVAGAMAGLLSSFAATFAVLAVSPDMGLATAFGCAAYAFGLAVQGGIRTAAGCVAGVALAIAIIVAMFPSYFLTVIAFSGGVFNLPVYANAHNIVLVAAAVFVLPSLIASALRNVGDARSPLALALATGGGIMLVGAFGRAAPFHVSCNGTVPLVTMFAAAAARGRKPLIAWMGTHVLLQIVLMQISWWSNSYGTLSTAFQLRKIYHDHPHVVAAWRDQWDKLRSRHPLGKNLHWSSVLPYPGELDQVAARGTIIQTNGGEWNLWLGRYLLLQPDAPKEFFHSWTQGADTPEQIKNRVKECAVAKFLMVPEYDLAAESQPLDVAAYEQNLDRWLSWAMLFPIHAKVRFKPFFPNSVITKELLVTHKPVGRLQFFVYGPFVLLERRDEATADRRQTDSEATPPEGR